MPDRKNVEEKIIIGSNFPEEVDTMRGIRVKHQITSTKSQIITNDLNSKFQTKSLWLLEVEVYLEFGIWILEFRPMLFQA